MPFAHNKSRPHVSRAGYVASVTSFTGRCTCPRSLAALGCAASRIMIAVSACGGSGSKAGQRPAVGDRFAARALAACASAQKSKNGWTDFPASSFDPTQPDARQLPQVGAWLDGEVQPTFDAWLSDLTALGEPPSGRKAWTEVLALVRKIDTLNKTQVQAARAGDTASFAAATGGLHNVQPQLESATADAGVGKCADVHAG